MDVDVCVVNACCESAWLKEIGFVVMCETSAEVLKQHRSIRTYLYVHTYMYVIYSTYVPISLLCIHKYAYVHRHKQHIQIHICYTDSCICIVTCIPCPGAKSKNSSRFSRFSFSFSDPVPPDFKLPGFDRIWSVSIEPKRSRRVSDPQTCQASLSLGVSHFCFENPAKSFWKLAPGCSRSVYQARDT